MREFSFLGALVLIGFGVSWRSGNPGMYITYRV